ncbi:JAB1/Mov34/MPN/PAD-1 ubiquitin protease-domain-containing protein [Kockovaella imperatae]|uniref:COP9 signalosome complex subunit 5 n=1 Tax=Kockovaella imperatae TaxID=4999 RepID=A0A1Y1UCZ4_9TREE|nr:JAB1/Mov34/MPN/PAD-1 ubiquitin protease-domain-containing protein [Kockovaella imperatae]ORX35910.1 JAB1/Mov34/MPN/PAD-1 ubiquitin protease-domain-containing protein [Kockovaella imperatae]
MDAAIARKTFELNNNVKQIDHVEQMFKYSREEEKALDDQAPWKTDPHYFHTVKISAVALIKMVIHARSGGIYEIMGVMYGKVKDGEFWIMDAAALPVQGTETRVNAGLEASEYMVRYQMGSQEIEKNELLRGWYHSHPGYGCWLSGIDVSTQKTNQEHTDPYLAVVIDPNRTVSAGKVEIGAFRTYPDNYTPSGSSSSQYQSIPMDKIEDFGVHANAYYPLKVEIFKSKLDEQLLDLLWKKYWVATLSQSLLISNREYATSQVSDLATKLASAAESLNHSSGGGLSIKSAHEHKGAKGDDTIKGDRSKTTIESVEVQETALNRATKDSTRITAEAHNGLTAQILKHRLFNTPLNETLDPHVAQRAVRGAM